MKDQYDVSPPKAPGARDAAPSQPGAVRKTPHGTECTITGPAVAVAGPRV